MAIDFTGLFTDLGHGFYIQEVVNTARGTTIPPTVSTFVNAFGRSSLPYHDIVDGTAADLTNYQTSGSGLVNSLKSTLANLVIQFVADDVSLQSPTLSNSMAELIRQMRAGSKSVKSNTVTASASACAGNGNGVMVVSAKRYDGLLQQTAYAEVMQLKCTSAGNPATAGFSIAGQLGVSDPLSWQWPGGSGATSGITAIDASKNSLVINGGMDVSTLIVDQPDSWIFTVGVPTTDYRMSVYEVQQIVVSGTPTAGTYRINFTDPLGYVQSTAPIAFNASGLIVQNALRQLEGLESVTVATTGTLPNYTHQITYTGVPGNLTQLTVSNSTTSGTFTVSTPTNGDALAYVNQSLILISDGSTLTTFYQPLTLLPLTQYAFNGWLAVNSIPSAGVLTIDLINGISGSVIADEQGANNTLAISAPGLFTTFTAHGTTFRTPRVLPPIIYLRIRISTAIDNATLLAIDHCALSPVATLYNGGPAVALFSGSSPFTAGDAQNPADKFTITVANDYGGELACYFERNFGMASLGLVLPSVTDGSETESDSLIA